MGARGTGGHKSQADRVEIACAGDFRDAMAGEISPDMMFFGIRRKGTKIHTYVLGIVSDWCGGMAKYGEARKKGKGGRNCHAGRVL